MILKPKNTERIRRHNLFSAVSTLIGQYAGRVYISVKEDSITRFYVLDEDSFLKHFDFTLKMDDIPLCDIRTFKETGINLIKF